MSDVSDPTKSQENPKRTEDNTSEAPPEKAAESSVPTQTSEEETPLDETPSEEIIPAEEESAEQKQDSEIAWSEYTESPELPATEEHSSIESEEPASITSEEEPPQEESETIVPSEVDYTESTESTDASPVDSAKEQDTDEPVSDTIFDDDTNDTDDELIVAAAASKVSSRFGGTRTEKIYPDPEPADSETLEKEKPHHGTVSAEVPPKEKKQKKEKKPKEPLPDVAPESKTLTLLSLLPCVTLLAFAALQGGIALFFRDLWPLQETQTAAVVKDTLAASNWLTPMLDGKPYSGAMPLYFWFTSAVALIPDVALTFAVKAATVISSMLFVLSTYLFSRAAGISKKTSLTSGLLVMAAFLPAVTMQINGLETLFAALVTFAHAAFVMGWKRQRSFFWLLIGFICAAAATLTGGFPGLFLPLFSIIFVSCWRKRPTRFGEWDVAGGFGIYLSIVLSWFAYVYFAVQPEYLLNLVPNILAAPFEGALNHLPYWWHMLAMLPFLLLPWLIVILLLPWTKLFSISLYKNILATRNPEFIGIAYLWLSAVLTCALYCVLDYMTPVWLLVLLPQLAILAARAISNFSPLRSKIFYRLLAVLFLGAGAGLIGLVNFTDVVPFAIDGWMYMSAILLAAAGIFWIKFPLNSRLGIVGITVVMTLLLQPLFIMSAPAINSFISTKDISVTMEEYAAKDFVPVVYNTDPAPFAYYVEKPITHAFDLHSLTTLLNANKNVVLIMTAAEWENWLTKPESLELVGRQGAAIPHLGKGFVLAIQEKRSTRYMPQDSTEPQPENMTPPATDEQPTVNEPETTPPVQNEPTLDAPQTDNEEDPAPLREPLNDNSTTATSPDTAQPKAAMVSPVTTDLTIPAN